MSNKAPAGRSVKGSYDNDHMRRRLRSFGLFANAVRDLNCLCDSEGKKLDYYLIHLERDRKVPDPREQWVKDRISCEISLENVQHRIEKDFGNFGVVGTNNYANPNYTEDTITLGILDIDVDENGNTKIPQRKIDEIIRALDTFTVQTRSGGYHFYFAASIELSRTFEQKYGSKNPHPRYQGIEFGEIRLNNQYVVGVGSYVPLDAGNQKRGHTPDATGYYEVLVNRPIRILTEADLSSIMSFGGRTTAHVSGNIEDNPFNFDWGVIEKMIKEDVDGLKSKRGVSFAETKIKWRNCGAKKLLAHLSAADIRLKDNESLETVSKDCGIDPDYLKSTYLDAPKIDRSKNDWYVALSLFEEGFIPYQIAAILQMYRPYSKTLDHPSMNRLLLNVYTKHLEN